MLNIAYMSALVLPVGVSTKLKGFSTFLPTQPSQPSTPAGREKFPGTCHVTLFQELSGHVYSL